jgi:hypothetical protein
MQTSIHPKGKCMMGSLFNFPKTLKQWCLVFPSEAKPSIVNSFSTNIFRLQKHIKGLCYMPGRRPTVSPPRGSDPFMSLTSDTSGFLLQTLGGQGRAGQSKFGVAGGRETLDMSIPHLGIEKWAFIGCFVYGLQESCW